MTLMIFGWILWCALHSLLISSRVNQWVKEQGGVLQGSYRLFYSLFSALSLIPLLWYQYSLPQEVLFPGLAGCASPREYSWPMPWPCSMGAIRFMM